MTIIGHPIPDIPASASVASDAHEDAAHVNALTTLGTTRQSLAAIDNVIDAKAVHDKAKGIQAYAREARNTDLLIQATQLLIESERRAGDLLIAMGARGELARPSDGVAFGANRHSFPAGRSVMPQTLAELGVTHKQSMKWQRLARMAETTPAKFDAYVQATISRVIAIFNVDGTTDNHRALGTGENEWYTPLPYLQAARRVMNNIDLDPASSAIAQRTVHAAHYFDLDTDGLAQDWYGNVWLNPPYAQPAISHFADKAIAELDAGHVTQMIVLTHNYTDTAWWHRLAAHANAICFTRGRIAFLDAHGNAAAPTQGQTFCYYGARRMAFGETFAPYGHVMVNP